VLLLLAFVLYYFPTSISESQFETFLSTSTRATFSKNRYAVLIDYSRPVFQKRLWLVDTKTKKVLLNCHVSHAKNTGFFWPNKYANKSGSELSCTGVFKTLHKYESNYGQGIYKLGLRLQGLDTSNNNTLKRNIVFHPSFPWWSKGCFMTNEKNNKFIIDKISNGSLVLVLR